MPPFSGLVIFSKIIYTQLLKVSAGMPSDPNFSKLKTDLELPRSAGIPSDLKFSKLIWTYFLFSLQEDPSDSNYF